MKASDRLNQVLAVIAVGCAVVSTAFVVRHGLRTRASASAPQTVAPPERMAQWDSLIATGHWMGPKDAKLVILEFSDFECPFCRRFTLGPLDSLRTAHPGEVAVVFRHWPLDYHRFAIPAATAAECAAAQGRFEAMHQLLFRRQDSLGLKSFASFGHDAGVTDSAAFAHCLAMPAPAVIDADRAVVRALGGGGTPTVLVNGWLYHGVPDALLLDSLVRAAPAPTAARP